MKPKTARSRRSLFVEVSQGRGGANEPSSSLFLPLFLLLSSPFPRSPAFAIRCSSLTNAYVCTSTYPFRPFHWNGEECSSHPALRSFRIIRPSFFSSHSVLLLFSALHSFLLLVFSSSRSHDSLYASACNYCRYVLFVLSFMSFCFFLYILFYFILFLNEC